MASFNPSAAVPVTPKNPISPSPYHVPSPSSPDGNQSEKFNQVPHQFPPDASPQQKTAIALQGANVNTLDPIPKLSKLTPFATDLGGGAKQTAKSAFPDPEEPNQASETTPSSALSKDDQPQHNPSEDGKILDMPGQLAPSDKSTQGAQDAGGGAAYVIPDWYRVGWNAKLIAHPQSAGSGEDAQLVKDVAILEAFFSEMYYGQWFHNAGVIFFAVAISHYLTRFGAGWSTLIIILSVCATYYKVSICRTRREMRSDLLRELSKQRLFQDHETVDWLNNFLDRFWLIYEPVLSATIVASVDQILIASTPNFLESIRMSTFTLGSKAPRIDFIRSHPETENDVVVMDWKFDFTPNDLSELTSKEVMSKVNPKIVLTIRFGKGLIAAAKDIVVENITFCGSIRIRIKLMNNFPHLQLVDLSFLEKPEFDFVLKPVGFDLNMIPGLSAFIESQVHASLGPMMYDPNVFTLNLEQMLAGAPIDTAVGVLQLKLYHARGLKALKIGGGTPDPYVTFSIGARINLDRTKVKRSTQNPNWNTTHFILLNSLNDILTMEVMDYNEVRKDTSLGMANLDLQTLIKDPDQEGLAIPILHQGKPRGEVRVDVRYHPCLIAKKLENGSEEPVPETTAGVVRLTVHQAKELDYKRVGTSSLSAYAKVYLNGKEILRTGVVKRTNHPVYESFIEVLVTEKDKAVFAVNVYDERTGEDPLIGQVKVKLMDLLEPDHQMDPSGSASAGQNNASKHLDWYPLKGGATKSGKIRLTASWKGLSMAGAINGAGAYTPPIGVLKFWFNRAEDLKNVEALTGGKSDPYVRVMRSGIVLARTQIHDNNLDPVFDEIIYVPVHHLRDSFRLEVMDYQHLTKDRSLGSMDLEAKSLIELSPSPTSCSSQSSTRSLSCEEVGTEKVESVGGAVGGVGFVGGEVGGAPVTRYRSTGKKLFSEFLRQEGTKKLVVKGKLEFEVEFYGCEEFEFKPFCRPNDEGAIGGDDDGSAGRATSGGGGGEEADRASLVAESLAINGSSLSSTAERHRRSGSVATFNTMDTGPIPPMPKTTTTTGTTGAAYAGGAMTKKKTKKTLKTLSKEEALGYQSGVLVFNVMGGEIAKRNARLEFLIDDGYWPAYSTEPSRSIHAKWDETGECFIRELDWSRCTMKLNVAEKETREEVYAEYSSGLRPFLEDCLEGPHEFVLESVEGGGNRSTVRIQCRYIPVPITLEPRESVNNMGTLSVLVDHGKDLPSADRNGYSDPYVQFALNGMRVFKSSVQKKTLNPKWNERFEVEVPSRVHANFQVQVFDWDRVGASDKIGAGTIDLQELEPMQQSTHVVKLLQEDQKQKGQIQVRLTFRPGFITRTRQATSTFTGLGRVATGLGGTVLAGGAGVGLGAAKGVGQVGGGVIKGVGGVGKIGFAGIRRFAGGTPKRDSVIMEDSESGILNSEQATPRLEGPSMLGTTNILKSPSPKLRARVLPTEYRLSMVIIGASGLESPEVKAYVHVKKNGKAMFDTKTIRHSTSPVWDESVMTDVKVGVETEFQLTIYDKKKLGKDKELGETRKLKVWEILEPEKDKYEAELKEGLSDSQGSEISGGYMFLRIVIVDGLSASTSSDSTGVVGLGLGTRKSSPIGESGSPGQVYRRGGGGGSPAMSLGGHDPSQPLRSFLDTDPTTSNATFIHHHRPSTATGPSQISNTHLSHHQHQYEESHLSSSPSPPAATVAAAAGVVPASASTAAGTTDQAQQMGSLDRPGSIFGGKSTKSNAGHHRFALHRNR